MDWKIWPKNPIPARRIGGCAYRITRVSGMAASLAEDRVEFRRKVHPAPRPAGDFREDPGFNQSCHRPIGRLCRNREHALRHSRVKRHELQDQLRQPVSAPRRAALIEPAVPVHPEGGYLSRENDPLLGLLNHTAKEKAKSFAPFAAGAHRVDPVVVFATVALEVRAQVEQRVGQLEPPGQEQR